MEDFEILFNKALEENNISSVPQTLAEKIVADSEAEFKGYGAEEESRQDEEKCIKEDIKNLEVQLHKHKNIKNHKLTHLNAKRSEKRKEIRRNITRLRVRLQEINDERDNNSKRE